MILSYPTEFHFLFHIVNALSSRRATFELTVITLKGPAHRDLAKAMIKKLMDFVLSLQVFKNYYTSYNVALK